MQAQAMVPEFSNPVDLMRGLDFLWLEITRKCNLCCVHCYTESSPKFPLIGRMRYADWRSILEQGSAVGCKNVQFIGGEPTLHPHLPDLIADARVYGYDLIEVFTNGTRLNDSLFSAFKESDVHLAFSVYARMKDVHEAITQKKGSFQKTLNGISTSLQIGLHVRVGLIAMEENMNEIDSAKTMLVDMGVETIGVDRLRGVGRGHERISRMSEFDELCGSCWKGKLRIDPDGNVSPCIFSEFYSVGHVSEGLVTILNSDRLGSFRQQVQKQAFDRDGCAPDLCFPDACVPGNRPCGPDCAPSCSPCVPDIRR